MFGEMSLITWLSGAIVLAIGGGAGFFLARQIKDKRTLELEQKLDAAQNKLSEYQDDVNRHFLKTSLLFNKLTDDYRDVYEHLATGAQKLCNEKTRITALDLPEAKILSAAIAVDATASAAITAEQAPEADTVSPTPDETEQDDAVHLGAESIVVTESIDTTNAEAAPTDETSQRAAEQTEDKTAAPATTEPVSAEASSTETTNTEDANTIETKPTEDRPTISAEELKILEANEQKKAEEEDIPLGAESTPSVELEHHKTHPSIH